MKQTTFEISLTSTSDDPVGQFRAVAQRVGEVAGVVRVEEIPELTGCTLHVVVNFADPKSAKRIHANVVRSVKKVPAIQVCGASTCMTDIFE